MRNSVNALIVMLSVSCFLHGSIAMVHANEKQVLKVPLGLTCQDLSNGTHYQYYEQGEVFQEIHCNVKQRSGIFRQYYPDGALWIEANYTQNQLNGEYLEYDQKGTLIQYGKYIFGTQKSQWRIEDSVDVSDQAGDMFYSDDENRYGAIAQIFSNGKSKLIKTGRNKQDENFDYVPYASEN